MINGLENQFSIFLRVAVLDRFYCNIIFFVDCGPLDDPINGAVDISQGTSYGNMVSYSCNQGHRLLGNSRRSCQADSFWTGSDPTCPVIGK